MATCNTVLKWPLAIVELSENWRIHQKVVLTFSKTSTGWRVEQRGT